MFQEPEPEVQQQQQQPDPIFSVSFHILTNQEIKACGFSKFNITPQ